MSANEIHTGDFGTQFVITVKEDGAAKDISFATTKQVIFTKPSCAKLTKTANFQTDGTDGVVVYTTIDGDIDEVGTWQLQVRVLNVSVDYYSDIIRFRVHDNL